MIFMMNLLQGEISSCHFLGAVTGSDTVETQIAATGGLGGSSQVFCWKVWERDKFISDTADELHEFGFGLWMGSDRCVF